MTEVFLNVLNLSISAGWLVLAVLVLRLLLKKAPKWAHVLLWGIVAARLLFPFSIESALSLIPSAQTIPPAVLTEPSFEITTGITPVDDRINDYLGDHYYQGVTAPAGQTFDVMTVLTVVWLVGMALLALYTLVTYFRLRRRVATAVRLRDNIFQSENVASPFVLGLVAPKIYLPFRMDPLTQDHVIAHEQAHLRRKDHWWKPLGFVLLTVHWFNPLLWLAYVLLCRDIEMACDEKVIRELGTDARADYSQALLQCSVNRPMIAACPLAFGEVGVKDRVKSVLNYKKPAFWVICIAVVLCIIVAVCFLTDPLGTRDYLRFTEPVKAGTGIYELSLGNQAGSGQVWVEQWVEGTCTQVGIMDLTGDSETIQIEVEKTHSTGEFYVYLSQGSGVESVSQISFPEDYDAFASSYQTPGQRLEVSPAHQYVLACFVPGHSGEVTQVPSCAELEENPYRSQGSYILVRVSFQSASRVLPAGKLYTRGSVRYDPEPLGEYPFGRQAQYAISEDMTFVARAGKDDPWTLVGTWEPLTLTEENFDARFETQSGSDWSGYLSYVSWDNGVQVSADALMSAPGLRGYCHRAWQIYRGQEWYYLMEGELDSLWLVYGTGDRAELVMTLSEEGTVEDIQLPTSPTLEGRYQVAEILCQPIVLSAIYPVDMAPSFSVTADRKLLVREQGASDWTSLGRLTGCNLTQENFDEMFLVGDGYMASFRERCVRAWKNPYADQVYVLQLDDGSFYLARSSQDDPTRMDWFYRLEADAGLELVPGVNYVTNQCLFFNDRFVIDILNPNDSGYRYRVEGDQLIMEYRSATGIASSLKTERDRTFSGIQKGWQPFPYTDEEWAAMYYAVTPVTDISQRYSQMLYLPLSEHYFLLRMDGEIWLVELISPFSDGKFYLCAIFTLVPEDAAGTAQWMADPLLSIFAPNFDFQFQVPGDTVLATCAEGTLSNGILSGNCLTLDAQGTLSWSPRGADGVHAETGKIYFQFGTGHIGTLYITSEGNSYTARVVGPGLTLDADGTVTYHGQEDSTTILALNSFHYLSPELKLHQFPHATLYRGNNCVLRDPAGETVLTDAPFTDAFLTDLTGDGLMEFCIETIVDQNQYAITVVDYLNHVRYLFNGDTVSYTLRMEDGSLVVTSRTLDHAPITTGTLVWDGQKPIIQWADGTATEGRAQSFYEPGFLAQGEAQMWLDRGLGTEAKTLTIPQLPNVTFYWNGQLWAVDGAQVTQLNDSWMTEAVFTADVTGDGIPDLVTRESFGSGMIDTYVCVYDYVRGIRYDLRDRGNYDFLPDLYQGDLVVRKYDYQTRDVLVSGTLGFADGTVQLVDENGWVVDRAQAHQMTSSGLGTASMAWVGWTDDPIIGELARNPQTLVPNGSHLAVFDCGTWEDLESLRENLAGVLDLESGWEGYSSLDRILDQYEPEFFDYNCLLLVYIPSQSTEYRYGLEKLNLDEGTLQIQLEWTQKPYQPEINHSGWILTLPLEKSFLNGITSLDAIRK